MATFKITTKEMPEVSKWKDGQEYTIRVRQTGHDASGVTLDTVGEKMPAKEKKQPVPRY